MRNSKTTQKRTTDLCTLKFGEFLNSQQANWISAIFDDSNVFTTPKQLACFAMHIMDELNLIKSRLDDRKIPFDHDYASVKELAEITGYARKTITEMAFAHRSRIRTIATASTGNKTNRRYHIGDFLNAITLKSPLAC